MTEPVHRSISVVVPFRNAERTLRRCLESLLAQEPPPLQVVAVDDASTDGSLHVARDVAKAHPRGGLLEVVARPVRGGAQRARMDAVAAARGDVVAFTDADCEAPAGWNARIGASLVPGIAAVGGEYRVPEGLPLLARFETRSLLDYWYRHMPEDTDHVATGCGAAWRSHLTPEVMSAGLAFADLTSGDDTAMSLALLAKGPLRFDRQLFVYHHTRTSLRGFLSQQLRRGQSRSRLSIAHFDVKVRRSRDTRMGLIAAHIATAGAAVAVPPLAFVLGLPWLAAAGMAPFVALQLPMLAQSARAGEGPVFLLAALPLLLLRNLTWGAGGLLGLVRALGARQVQPA